MGTASPLQCSAGVNGRFLSLPPSLPLSTLFLSLHAKVTIKDSFAADPKVTSGVLSKSAAQLSKGGRRKATLDTASPQCSAGESGRFLPPSLPPSPPPPLSLSLPSRIPTVFILIRLPLKVIGASVSEPTLVYAMRVLSVSRRSMVDCVVHVARAARPAPPAGRRALPDMHTPCSRCTVLYCIRA